jgi:LmbE family N-acetylglucosaminyl deacetylase
MGDDVVVIRRSEDAAALREVAAKPVWLDFLDAQYGPSPPASAIARCLAKTIATLNPDQVVMPLGLFHSDHRLTTRACIAAMRALRDVQWLAYAEALYRCIPGLTRRRIGALERLGFRASPIDRTLSKAGHPKRRAVAAYASQLRALATTGRQGHEDAFAPEQIWRLERR